MRARNLIASVALIGGGAVLAGCAGDESSAPKDPPGTGNSKKPGPRDKKSAKPAITTYNKVIDGIKWKDTTAAALLTDGVLSSKRGAAGVSDAVAGYNAVIDGIKWKDTTAAAILTLAKLDKPASERREAIATYNRMIDGIKWKDVLAAAILTQAVEATNADPATAMRRYNATIDGIKWKDTYAAAELVSGELHREAGKTPDPKVRAAIGAAHAKAEDEDDD